MYIPEPLEYDSSCIVDATDTQYMDVIYNAVGEFYSNPHDAVDILFLQGTVNPAMFDEVLRMEKIFKDFNNASIVASTKKSTYQNPLRPFEVVMAKINSEVDSHKFIHTYKYDFKKDISSIREYLFTEDMHVPVVSVTAVGALLDNLPSKKEKVAKIIAYGSHDLLRHQLKQFSCKIRIQHVDMRRLTSAFEFLNYSEIKLRTLEYLRDTKDSLTELRPHNIPAINDISYSEFGDIIYAMKYKAGHSLITDNVVLGQMRVSTGLIKAFDRYNHTDSSGIIPIKECIGSATLGDLPVYFNNCFILKSVFCLLDKDIARTWLRTALERSQGEVYLVG